MVIAPFSTDLIGWLRIIRVCLLPTAAYFGVALAFTRAVWLGVEVILGWRKR